MYLRYLDCSLTAEDATDLESWKSTVEGLRPAHEERRSRETKPESCVTRCATALEERFLRKLAGACGSLHLKPGYDFRELPRRKPCDIWIANSSIQVYADFSARLRFLQTAFLMFSKLRRSRQRKPFFSPARRVEREIGKDQDCLAEESRIENAQRACMP